MLFFNVDVNLRLSSTVYLCIPVPWISAPTPTGPASGHFLANPALAKFLGNSADSAKPQCTWTTNSQK